MLNDIVYLSDCVQVLKLKLILTERKMMVG